MGTAPYSGTAPPQAIVHAGEPVVNTVEPGTVVYCLPSAGVAGRKKAATSPMSPTAASVPMARP
jgi:hypothetical protein